ncbi:flagellar biosynthesis regulator FlaF [Neorhizobium sp. NCHU2750]|uniref:flagellar biosynthesis regulator FlaF n=1 Tax=Neorhizobium sp. NCHU2750 TaxID=1825976 RepID=UPI000E737B60|nr:flagellar biosynthesis regulator [Neorhizobium sp. NCHU2750]
MFQFSYAEVMEDDLNVARDRERQILTRSIDLLEAAKESARYDKASIEAIYYTRRVWMRLAEDLRSSENQLSVEIRANLISIAIWILKELENIRRRKSTNYQGIIDITIIIRDGLK